MIEPSAHPPLPSGAESEAATTVTPTVGGAVATESRRPSHPAAEGASAAAREKAATERAAAERAAAERAELAAAIEDIVQSRHADPHAVLGPHLSADGRRVTIRAFLPHAAAASLRLLPKDGRDRPMQRVHPDGVFEITLDTPAMPLAYQVVIEEDGAAPRAIYDPYAQPVATFTEADAVLFESGRHTRLFEILGAHPLTLQGVRGTRFAVWAPAAQRVSVAGTFNRWDGRCHPMRRLAYGGVWELFIPGVGEGDLYKFEIKTPGGMVFLKADPFAFRTEAPPQTASIVHDIDWGYSWLDGHWMRHQRSMSIAERPLAVYPLNLDHPEAELGIPAPASFARLIEAGVPQVIAARGYSHMVLQHDAAGFWGSASLFAPGQRYGLPDDLCHLIDACHQVGLGVVLPAPPDGLPAASEELAWFDGTQAFLVAGETVPGDGRVPPPPRLNTDRGEVRSVVLSSFALWFDRYHFDAVAVSAARAPLVLDLLRREQVRLRSIRVIETAPAAEPLAPDVAELLGKGRHPDPHGVLGVHLNRPAPAVGASGAPPAPAAPASVLRVLFPEAEQVHAVAEAEPQRVRALQPMTTAGLFETALDDAEGWERYRISVRDRSGRTFVARDSYAFRDWLFSDLDQHLFSAGNHYRIFEKLGGHPRSIGGIDGVNFCVWAPNAAGVSVVGAFNNWDGRRHQMHRHGASGVWETFIPDIGAGELYKFEMRSAAGTVFLKADPYALATERPPASASIVYPLRDCHVWRDDAWMEQRRTGNPWQQPMAIYEVHLGSWLRHPGGESLSYRELADRLIPYVKDLGFTHIELLPITEHPYEPSWGYQVTNYYAPTSRHGRPEDLMAFIDACHRQGIGVILDWVPAHFPKDAFALAWYDGTHLYEHADPRQGEHRDWGTLIFNYGRHEVENFLIANALFWLEFYHFDGLRVDAVASMLYLDYSKPQPGDWIPNKYGGRENIDAIEFLKHTNAVVHERFPGVLMIAEESTAWPKVSRPAHDGGLGFGFKWNMGWMHDVLGYFACPPEYRSQHHNKLTFGLLYAFDENFILSLSHDEVVHMKRSLLNKMPGDDWEKFANLRLLFLFMYTHPGKKLIFMGGEFGQRSEWNHARSLEWELLEFPLHHQLKKFIADLNHFYVSQPALFEVDFRHAGFDWLEVDNGEESIIAFLRKERDPRQGLVVILNFSAVSRPAHRLGVPYPVGYEVLFDSNADRFGGCGGLGLAGHRVIAEPVEAHGQAFSIVLPVAALSGVVLRPDPPLGAYGSPVAPRPDHDRGHGRGNRLD